MELLQLLKRFHKTAVRNTYSRLSLWESWRA